MKNQTTDYAQETQQDTMEDQEMSTLPEEWKYAFTKENEEDALVGREDQAVDKEAKQAEGQGEKEEARKKSTSPPT
jgi:hypothetical protein